MDHADRHQHRPRPVVGRQVRQIGERGQHRHADAGLDQRDQMRAHARQPLGDDGRDRIEERGTQRQRDTAQIVGGAMAVIGLRLHDHQHAGEGDQQPGQLGQRDAFGKQQRAQCHQHERLRVVDRRRDRNRGARIGRKQQQPVHHDRDAAQCRQAQRAPGQLPQHAQRGADRQQRQRAEQAAPEHDVADRLSGLDHEPADGAGQHHRGRHFGSAA